MFSSVFYESIACLSEDFESRMDQILLLDDPWTHLAWLLKLMVHPAHLAYGPPGSRKHSSVSYSTIILILVILDLRQTRSLEIRFLKYLAKLDFIFLFRAFCDNSFVGHAKKEADMYSIQMTF